MKRACIKVIGIVQGVGFRPFVFMLAQSLNIKGFVLNLGSSLYIEAEGENIASFLKSLKNDAPQLSKIHKILVNYKEPLNYKNFEVRKSSMKDEAILIPCDTSICIDCETELYDKNNKRYLYPFINCTNCGPRFSIIKSVPYDRENTSMQGFKMCVDCEKEYNDIKSRRYLCEPISCEKCGPTFELFNSFCEKVLCDDVIQKAIEILKQGKIIAIKGIGGYHLVCDALNDNAVIMLRQRKKRDEKPFAVMANDIDTVKQFCRVNLSEENLLKSSEKPIVLLKKKNNIKISKLIAPKNRQLGFMLPYTPIQKMLFEYKSKTGLLVLVMTSGNISGEPICFLDDEAKKTLSQISDYVLVNNREILEPSDDSVLCEFNKKPYIIRRSRGFVPSPFINNNFFNRKEIFATGADLKSSFCFAKDGKYYLSRHIGDLEDLKTSISYEKAFNHYKKFLMINPQILACDMHPNYFSTFFANKMGIEKISVQHHFAHTLSCMFENNIKNEVIGVVFDGTGYGTDQTVWGGEFLVCSLENFKRAGHLNTVSLFGNDTVSKEPWRCGISYIFDAFGKEFLENEKNLWGLDNLTLNLAINSLNKGINTFKASSCGRLFDAVAFLCNNNIKNSYEGQAATELMNMAKIKNCGSYDFDILKGEPFIIDTKKVIKQIYYDIKNNVSISTVSKKFHSTLSDMVLKACLLIREKYNINIVTLSGGVFQNMVLLKETVKILRNSGFFVYTHSNIPANDGGVAIGQAVFVNR